MKKVLIVDDEAMNREVIVKVLQKEGFSVDEAENGQEAIKSLQTTSYDLILMDLMMPVMDGFEAIRAIRTQLHLHIPIITLSALNDTESIHHAIKLGANNYLIKPYNLTGMLKLVKEALQ